MAALSSFFKVGSAFALITGTSDVLLGVGIVERTTGVSFPVNSAAAVFADSQIRFLGGMWAGWGAMLWWASNDLRTRRVPLNHESLMTTPVCWQFLELSWSFLGLEDQFLEYSMGSALVW